MRVKYRWQAVDLENKLIQQHKERKTRTVYVSEKLANGETRKELLARSRFLLDKNKNHWTADQKERAKVLFREYPLLKIFYHNTLRFRAIYKLKTKQEAKRKIIQCLYLIKQENKEAINTVAQSIQYHIQLCESKASSICIDLYIELVYSNFFKSNYSPFCLSLPPCPLPNISKTRFLICPICRGCTNISTKAVS